MLCTKGALAAAGNSGALGSDDLLELVEAILGYGCAPLGGHNTDKRTEDGRPCRVDLVKKRKRENEDGKNNAAGAAGRGLRALRAAARLTQDQLSWSARGRCAGGVEALGLGGGRTNFLAIKSSPLRACRRDALRRQQERAEAVALDGVEEETSSRPRRTTSLATSPPAM